MSTGRTKLRALRAHLNQHLFPAEASVSGMFGRGEYLALALALFALAVVLQLARLGWTASLETLWAEDGQIFLQGALTESFGHAVTSVYANYLVLVPRLIAEAATLVPLQDAPAAVSIASAAVVALSGLIVWHAAAAHIESPYLRGTLAALTVLAPVAGLESIDSASYVSWYMLFATFWILLWRPATMRGATVASIFVIATALSNPGVWFFIPLAVLRAIAARDRRDAVIVASFAAGAAIQMPVLALSHEAAVDPSWSQDIWAAYLQRVIDGAPLGLRLGGNAWAHLGWPFMIGLVLAAVAGLVLGVRRAGNGVRYLAAIAIPTSLAMFVASLYQRALGAEMVWPEGFYSGNGGRYAIVPALLVVSVAVALLDDSRRKRGRESSTARRSWPTAAAVAILLAAIATSFDARDPAARGMPRWDAALRAAADACVSERLPAATVPISPPGFGVALPCERISSFAEPEPATGSG